MGISNSKGILGHDTSHRFGGGLLQLAVKGLLMKIDTYAVFRWDRCDFDRSTGFTSFAT
jgi:hypothetical protein